jgi:prophage regulatory protein
MALWRASRVSEQTGLARTTIYKMVSEGRFPAPVRLTSNTSAWRSEEVERWISERPLADTVKGPHRRSAGR